MKTILLLLSVSLSFAQAPKEKMISFVGIGACNMQGRCAEMDTIINPRVWSYSPVRGFFNCTDKDISANSGSPMMPFLKAMALRYPTYNFCGLKLAGPGRHANHVLGEQRHREALFNELNWLLDKSTIGGIILSFGTMDAKDRADADSLCSEMTKIIKFIRGVVGKPTLPVILMRYEKNGPERMSEYTKYQDLVIEKLNCVASNNTNTIISPTRDIPLQYYCDPAANLKQPHDYHCYAKEGYEILGQDMATQIQSEKFDFWNKE